VEKKAASDPFRILIFSLSILRVFRKVASTGKINSDQKGCIQETGPNQQAVIATGR
jgi:hypothetical protein